MSQQSLFPHQKLEWLSSRLESQLQDHHVNDPAIRLQLARVTLSSGLFHKGGESACARALGQAKKVLREDPTSIEALIISGLSLIGMERPESAQRHLERAYELDPNRADLQLALGSLSRAQGRFADMIHFLEAACNLAPNAWEPHLLLGRSLLAMGRKRFNDRTIERAQFHLVRALEMNNTQEPNFDLVLDLGIASLMTGRVREAERFFNRLREDPKHEATARLYLGQVAYKLGKHNNAINHFRQYLSYKADDASVIARMALAWFQLEDYQRAREACHQAMLVEPFNLMARHILGCALLEEGDSNEALRVFRETLKERPDHMPSYIEIVRTRRLSGDINWLNQALKVEVSNYDRQPLGGEYDAKLLTRTRIDVILDELKNSGPEHAILVLRAIDYTQDESLRFLLWETASNMVEDYVATETAASLRTPGINYSVDLGEAAACLGTSITESVLTAGLNITEQDLQRAATERYPPAHDVLQHRQNLDKERNAARGYQALLLLAVAIKGGENGKKLLKEWVANADKEMGYASKMGLGIMGDADALSTLKKESRSRDKLELITSLDSSSKSAPADKPLQLIEGSDDPCHVCGKKSPEEGHLMIGGQSVICSSCVIKVSQNRQDMLAAEDATCDLCGQNHFNVSSIYKIKNFHICEDCVQLSLGAAERRDVAIYFEERFA